MMPAGSPGTLYVVGTPIGNLEDLTFRGLRILRQVDIIAAEDTRRTRGLLTHYGVKTRLLSYREQNRDRMGAQILGHLREGRSVALVTDAGTPGLSDPGHHLVRLCADAGIPLLPIPGASALTTALSISGMALNGFLFEGFLPSRSSARRGRLSEIGATGMAFVLYESPARVVGALEDIIEILGDREVLVARELTKMHEEVVRGTAVEVARRWEQGRVQGEVTVVVAGSEAPPVNLHVLKAARRLLKEGLAPSRTAAVLAELTGQDRQSLYRIVTGLPEKEEQGGDDG